MSSDSQLYVSGASRIRFTETCAKDSGAPASYRLLLVFLILLYANLPFILPATEVLRPAKVVAAAAILMLVVEAASGRRTLELAWPEGCWLVVFLGAAALSCFTALWPGHAVEELSELAKMVLSYYFIVNCANTKRRLRGVMWTMIVGAILPAIGTLRNYSNGQLFEGRASWVGIFANPNEVAYSLIILIPIAAALANRLKLIPRLGVLAICLL